MICALCSMSAQDTAIWNGTDWVDGIEPTWEKNAIINGNFTLEYDLEAKDVTISSGFTLTIPAKNSLTIYGDVENNGNIVIENDANFWQKASASKYSGSGTATVKREARLKKNDFNYWSSPVTGQNLYAFSEGYNQADPLANTQGTPWYDFYVYDEKTDYFVTMGLDASSQFDEGRGYAIRGKNKYGNILTTETFSFNGKLNNGSIDIVLDWSGVDNGYNLVGNPYPSNIDAIALMKNNSKAIKSNLWFWTNTNEVTSQQGSNYQGNNYAMKNLTGGAPSTYVNGSDANDTPTQFIKVAQGFIVQAKGNNNVLKFTNNIRSNNPSSNFYNKSSDEEDDETKKDRYWLKLISPQNIVNTILVAYVDGATNNYDDGYDADLMVVGSDSFYSVLGAHKLQIQGRKPGLDLDDVVALGNKHYIAGKNTIALDDKNGIFANGQAIYLKDKITGKITNLQDESYSFDSATGEFADRFEIVYKTTLAVGDTPSKKISVFKDQSDFVIRTPNKVQSVDLYDMSGRMIQSINAKNASGADIRISHTQLNKGVYIIRVNQNGEIFTQKVIK